MLCVPFLLTSNLNKLHKIHHIEVSISPAFKLFADLIKSFPTPPRQYMDSTWVSTWEITLLPGLPSHIDKPMSAHLSKHDIEMSENDTGIFKYDAEMFHWN